MRLGARPASWTPYTLPLGILDRVDQLQALATFLKQYGLNHRINLDFSHPVSTASYRIAMHINDLSTIYRDVPVSWGDNESVSFSATESESDWSIREDT